MTSAVPARGRNPSRSHAAFALHHARAMRSLVVACALFAPLLAHAQGTGTGTGTGSMGAGSCTGQIAGTVGLAVPQSDGSFLSVPTGTVPYVFGQAECECSKDAPNTNPNINLEIRLTQALPLGSSGHVEVWVGSSDCSSYTTRTTTNQTRCQQLTGASNRIDQFTSGGGSGLIHFSIPADLLASPNMSICDPAQNANASNSIFVFVVTNDPTMPAGTCTLNLTEQNQGPVAPTGAAGSGGDSAVTLTWTPPQPGSFVPKFFQILCSDDCGNPIKSSPNKAAYSVCENGMLQRRDLVSGGSAVGTGGTDGGVTTTPDLGARVIPPAAPGSDDTFTGVEPIHGNAASPISGCNPDMGVGTGDGGTNPWDTDTNPLSTLDPAYVCSDQLNSSSSTQRIDGLQNGQTYHFVVLGIDQFGNASPSNLVTAQPQPTEDLYRRYRDAGGGAGHCFIATAAFGSYENRWVQVLRDFRDVELLPHAWGRSFVEWYYAHSPPAADWIAAHGWARALVRLVLAPVIAFAWLWLHTSPWLKALLFMSLIAYALRRRLAAALRRGTPA